MGHECRIRTTAGVWLLLALLVMLLPLPWLLAVCISSIFHELCHLAAVKLTGGSVTGLFFRADGAHLETLPMPPLKSAVCSLAGPMGSLLLLFSARWMPRTALCAAVQSAYHLLPLYPLDGGRALRSLGEFFGWNSYVLSAVECSVMAMLALAGIYLAVTAKLGLVPVCLSAAMIFRVCREKFLANSAGTGYNR